VFNTEAAVSASGSFSTSTNAGGTALWTTGTYTVTASWSNSISTPPITSTSTFHYQATGGNTGTTGNSLVVVADGPSLVYAGQTAQIDALAYWTNGTLAKYASTTAFVYLPSGTLANTFSKVSGSLSLFPYPLPATSPDGFYDVVVVTTTGNNTTAYAQTGFTVNSQVVSVGGLTGITGMLKNISAWGTTITGLSTSIGTINTNLNSLTTSVNSISSMLSTIGNNAQAAATAAQSASTAVTGLQNSITSLQSSIGSLTSSVTTLQSDVTSIQGSITNLAGLSTTVGNLQTSVNNLNSTVSNDQTYILVVAALAVITLVLELAILIRKMS
jgi:hypothetical protein